MPIPLHHWDARLKHMVLLVYARRGPHTRSVATTLGTHGNTTDVTRSISAQQKLNVSAKQYFPTQILDNTNYFWRSHLSRPWTILLTSSRANYQRTVSLQMLWSNSWRYTRYKPKKQHAKPKLKGCSGRMHRLKGWRMNSRQQHSRQFPSRTPHCSQLWRLKTATLKVSATQEDLPSYPKTTTKAQRTTNISNTSHER